MSFKHSLLYLAIAMGLAAYVLALYLADWILAWAAPDAARMSLLP
jgi:hypothetical protein